MARTGRPSAKPTLSAEERTALERLARRGRTNSHLAMRAKIILKSEEGLPNMVVAERLRTSEPTVGKWRRRFITGRVAALYDEPRPGAPRKISGDEVEDIVVKTLASKPKGRTDWSTRSIAKAAGVSHASVGRIGRAFGLQPHIVHGLKLSTDPLFIEKVRDIVGLYMSP